MPNSLKGDIIMTYKEYEGPKFRYVGLGLKYEGYNEPTIIKQFKMTSKYASYLRDKQEYEADMRIKTLKAKIDYQIATYGEADEIEVNLYHYLLKAKTIETQRNIKKQEHQYMCKLTNNAPKTSERIITCSIKDMYTL